MDKFKEENYNCCKRIAEELEAYASGDYCKCSTCGEIFEEDEIKTEETETEMQGGYIYTEEEKICPKCNTCLDDIETLSLYDYFNDFLDVEYIVDSQLNYISSKIYITLGGPTVWIDTAAAEVRLRWGSEKASYTLHLDVNDQINEIFEEFYNNLKGR